MKISPSGWCDSAQVLPSPFFNERPEEQSIDLVVIHNISLPAGKFGTGDVDTLFMGCLDCQKDPSYEDLKDLKVSSHFFISRTGELKQYVSCKERAWHAGVSCFQGRENCNDFSIGIELEGTDNTKFESVQYERLAALLDAIADVYPIKAVAGHSDIAPNRKTDPGPCFSWLRLIRLCENGRIISFPYVK